MTPTLVVQWTVRRMSEFLVSWGGGPRDGRWCLTTCLVNRAADELGMFQNIGWDGKSENVGEGWEGRKAV